ncbi:MAG: hypothetical protein ACR2PG_00250 [Hyphomicrobiaceae bacterium]
MCTRLALSLVALIASSVAIGSIVAAQDKPPIQIEAEKAVSEAKAAARDAGAVLSAGAQELAGKALDEARKLRPKIRALREEMIQLEHEHSKKLRLLEHKLEDLVGSYFDIRKCTSVCYKQSTCVPMSGSERCSYYCSDTGWFSRNVQ